MPGRWVGSCQCATDTSQCVGEGFGIAVNAQRARWILACRLLPILHAATRGEILLVRLVGFSACALFVRHHDGLYPWVDTSLVGSRSVNKKARLEKHKLYRPLEPHQSNDLFANHMLVGGDSSIDSWSTLTIIQDHFRGWNFSNTCTRGVPLACPRLSRSCKNSDAMLPVKI